jgi:hypothetical protein
VIDCNYQDDRFENLPTILLRVTSVLPINPIGLISNSRELVYRLSVGITLTLSAFGFYTLSAHMYTEGAGAQTPCQWPTASQLNKSNELTAVLFVHPHCPCTLVTIAELEQLLTEAESDLRVQVVFAMPPGEPAQWIDSPLAKRVSQSRHCQVVADVDSHECQQFGVTTSGHFILFDRAGHKLIDGGLTTGRGVEGPSAGLHALATILNKGVPAQVHFPVYGCSLIGL